MMQALLEFAQGPLFAMTFLFMALALAREVYLQALQMRLTLKRTANSRFSFLRSARSFTEWLIPAGHSYRNRAFFSLTSLVFHLGLLVTPIFLLAHIGLWQSGLGLAWPALPGLAADVLTMLTVLTACILFAFRIFSPPIRALSDPADYLLLVLLCLPFVTGFMAHVPAVNPLSYQAMLLLHVLSAELIFVLIPFTKLVHCVLFPFDRVSSEVFWQLPAGAGESVARELRGEEAKI